jgi:hypothetical protein
VQANSTNNDDRRICIVLDNTNALRRGELSSHSLTDQSADLYLHYSASFAISAVNSPVPAQKLTAERDDRWRRRHCVVSFVLWQISTEGENDVSLYLAIPALAAEGKGASEQSSAISTTPCNLEGVSEPVRCGVLHVPENPIKENGRRIALNIAIIPALADTTRRDPIVLLMGGPGEDAMSAGAWFLELFASLRRDRDILLIDQRGTGRSGGLQCDLYSPEEAAANLRDVYPVAAVQRCERQLRSRADLTQYSYSHFATDLEQVRRALGYEQLN